MCVSGAVFAQAAMSQALQLRAAPDSSSLAGRVCSETKENDAQR